MGEEDINTPRNEKDILSMFVTTAVLFAFLAAN